MYLAIGSPPAQYVGLVLCGVGIVLSIRDKDWKFGLLFGILAAFNWPWG